MNLSLTVCLCLLFTNKCCESDSIQNPLQMKQLKNQCIRFDTVRFDTNRLPDHYICHINHFIDLNDCYKITNQNYVEQSIETNELTKTNESMTYKVWIFCLLHTIIVVYFR